MNIMTERISFRQLLQKAEIKYGHQNTQSINTIAELVAYILKNEGKTLSSAESCTGGTIASKLTAIPGASEYYKGGVVSYCNEIKEKILGANHDTLERYTAVSEETVREMAQGAKERLCTDYAVATTGIAGPGGGTAEQPVGTVWLGIATPDKVLARKVLFSGQRAEVIHQASEEILLWLTQNIINQTINNEEI